jgi:hypothetical protein
VYVRWQLRKNIPNHLRQPIAGPSIGAPPAAHDLALEVAARAVTRVLPRSPRWTNARSGGAREPRRSWVAVIVESRRVDGRPRQHLIRYVGSIDSSDVQLLSARRRFWDRADAVLAEFDQKQRERFELALSAKVPRPTSEEEVAAGAAFAARYRLPISTATSATCRLTRTSTAATVVQSFPTGQAPSEPTRIHSPVAKC